MDRIFIDTQEKLIKNLPYILNIKKCSLDTETSGLDCFINRLLLLQIGTLEKAFIIDVTKVNILPLKKWLENPNIYKVGVNLVFDYKFLKHYGIEPEGLVDIMLIEQILLAGIVKPNTKGYFSLEALSKKYLDTVISKKERATFVNHVGEFTQEQLDYAFNDVLYPLLILEKQKPIITQHELSKIVLLENKVIPCFGDMEYNGFYLNASLWETLLEKTKEELYVAEKKLDNIFKKDIELTLFGTPNINYSSDLQLKEALKKIGHPLGSTGHSILLESLPQFLYEPIINYRTLEKAVDSFGENYLKFIHPKTNRLHFRIHQIGADSGRSSTSNPSMQNIKQDSNYRHCFTSQSEETLISQIDFSGQELRISAQKYKEPMWMEILNKQESLHVYMGTLLFGTEVNKKTNPALYKITKNLDFSMSYLGGPSKVMGFFKEAGLECDFIKAQEVVNLFAKIAPKVFYGARNEGVQTVINGYASCLLGRKRFFNVPKGYRVLNFEGKLKVIPVDKADEKLSSILHKIQREGANHIIQSTGASMLKLSLFYNREELKLRGYKNCDVHVVHDEIISEVPKDYVQEYHEITKKAMLKAEQEILPDLVPEVEGSVGKCWTK
jgi:DNA polymerase I-like protein with 3'-5' exonuclease and polymerase domains